MYHINKSKTFAAVSAAVICLSVSGCAKREASPKKTTAAVNLDSADHEISAEDKDVGFSEDDSVKISLSGSEAEISGSGAELADGRLSISEAGTYILSGDFTGQIYVKSKGSDIRLVLDGVSVTNGTDAALLIDKAEKVTLTLAEGSENYFADGENYTSSDPDSNVDGAIFSRADLTINGEGALSVSGNYKHGIVGKDNVVIAGGSVSVTAVSTAVSGKDSVKIGGGVIDLDAGTNGIHSTNTEEDGKGIISVSGGTLAIISAGDALQAERDIIVTDGDISAVTGGGSENAPTPSGFGGNDFTAVSDENSVSAKGLKAGGGIQINGGSISVDCCDDGIHADGSIGIDGGKLSAKSGDDGIHADGELVISGGSVEIQKSYEGIEGKYNRFGRRGEHHGE